VYKDITETKAWMHLECLETGFFQISSMISAHDNLDTILATIVQEALNCLRANRCTIFFLDGKSGLLKTHFTYSSEPLFELAGLYEERQVARKILEQNRPFLLREEEDFSGFFKYGERERKITSLMSTPISSQGKTIGVLSAVLINQEDSFDDKSLRFLLSFSNHASIAIEMAHLLEELHRRESLQMTIERYLDDFLNKLQTLSEMERRERDRHIAKLKSE
jgi:GAF domain-containing protein